MSQIRKSRDIFFVCSGLSDTKELISKTIKASTLNDAKVSFFKETGIYSDDISGPFFKTKQRAINNSMALKFSNEYKKAIYNNWEVNAFFLNDPKDHAYLVFIKNLVNNKSSTPKGVIVVPISELRYI